MYHLFLLCVFVCACYLFCRIVNVATRLTTYLQFNNNNNIIIINVGNDEIGSIDKFVRRVYTT
jgi:hypothetical protein